MSPSCYRLVSTTSTQQASLTEELDLLNSSVKFIEVFDLVEPIPLKVGMLEEGVFMSVEELVHVAWER